MSKETLNRVGYFQSLINFSIPIQIKIIGQYVLIISLTDICIYSKLSKRKAIPNAINNNDRRKAKFYFEKTLSITALCRFLNRVLEPAAGTA